MNYIGSKLSLIDFIDETTTKFTKKEKKQLLFCDIFSGTGAVAKHFKTKGYNIIANDIQFYSYLTIKHFIENNSIINFDKLPININNPFDYLNNLVPKPGFIFQNYSLGGTISKETPRMFFSDSNAKKIDVIRNQIDHWKKDDNITEKEQTFLIASLIESADKVANTASVYEAYLKKIKPSAKKEMILKPIETIINKKSTTLTVYNKDANELITEISGDILYLDPPYNARRYDTNYHMLETIALYDNPKIKGKSGRRVEEDKKSDWCKKKEAPIAFENLIKNAKFKYIILSYNDEGIIPLVEIERIMRKYGNYKRYEKEYKRFKADKNREYKKDTTIEYLHCLEKHDI